MSRKTPYPGLDACNADYGAQLLALCYVLTCRRKAGEELAFQTFLRLSAREAGSVADERMFLFREAYRLAEDYYAQKMRKPPKLWDMEEEELPFEVDGELLQALRAPLSRRCVLFLKGMGMQDAEIHEVCGIRTASNIEEEKIKNILRRVRFPQEESDLILDKVYERFAERSVSVENALLDARAAFSRIAPWLALAVLVFFAFCIWFVSR